MNNSISLRQKVCSDCKRMTARMGAIVTVTGTVTGKELSYNKVTRETCLHAAKVKMAGYKNMYECTTCHKFIPYDPDAAQLFFFTFIEFFSLYASAKFLQCIKNILQQIR